MSRKKILIGNWKLNHNRKSAQDFFDEVIPESKIGWPIDVAVAPVAPMLDFVGRIIAKVRIELAAQNVFYENQGAFTGEWSAAHLKELGVRYCIVGHSERRRMFFESDEDVRKKARSCLGQEIVPVVCVGESLAERELGQTNDLIRNQVLAVIRDFRAEEPGEFIIAYEPIWAIGTGKTASREEAQEVHQFIRGLIREVLGEPMGSFTRIIYGGSVTGQNIREIAAMPDIDGALVGGASLHAASFLSMVEGLHDIQ
ncbi:MAG TPA: triose-phosphate isomerase [Myxococcota bacterium]|nr:triose-phosphate isomerase [Myxococcota bacterium]